MGTIAKLVTEMGADPTGLRRGFREAATEVQNFARTTQQTFANMAPPLPPNLPPAWRDNARRTGAALAREVSAGFGEGNAISNIRRALDVQMGGAGGGHGFLGTGLHLGGRHAFGIGLGVFSLLGDMEGVEAEKDHLAKVGRSIEEIIRALTLSIAVSLDPTHGAIVAVIGGGISAIVGHFAHMRSEAAKLADDVEKNLRRVINASQQMPEIMALDVGERAAGPSAFVQGVSAGGLIDLEARLAAQQDALRHANFVTVRGIQQNIKELEAQIAPLRTARNRLVASVLDVTPIREPRLAVPITVAARAPLTPAQQLEALQQSATSLLSLAAAIEKAHSETRKVFDTGGQLLGVYDKLSAALAAMPDPWTDQAQNLRKLLIELEKSDIINILRGTGPGTAGFKYGLTPQRIEMKPVDIKPPDLGNIGPTLGSRFMAAIGPFLDTLTNVAGPAIASFAAALGPAALLMLAIQPALKILQPLLENFVAPLAAVAEVIAESLAPVLKLLFPIVRTLAIALSLLSEISMRVTAVIARAFGNLVMGIGELLKRLTFGLAGNSVKNAGQSLINFADATKKSADEMAAVRKKLGGMQWGQTADDITGLGDAARATAEALRSVPEIWKINLEKWRVAHPLGGGPISETPTGAPTPTGRTGTGHGPAKLMAAAGEGIVFYVAGDVNVEANDPQAFFAKLAEAATKESLRTTGRPGSWTRMLI